ncbi:50S ribosomal protein L15 [Candidatus Roizmanbacteria bacterium RIFCSPHIGHO2_02_FULL_37_13b]|uniref:Large ribosomal subunit protein uL15 n=1 Tax=Candidatus Roizmanbacteria bacterium RIFCSPLOWO2_02_FULL_36_11 TaxID=1802071 RepID=A0A1F7JCH6_9BACT|nr:MAG: 50S ribosomal protein L15 [Candidatus Roizmanbacteria bacterium RIFCSPHIGHO2_02_FULL_37_13b]OGK53318.1 MAG: 50S ribosomal protein L15 [Candidatus Roizmanbacteria bacterium RIFCSPLOWO2_02_FULL_36_11]
MITLNNLPKIKQKTKKRLGRGTGSGAGAKSGRGTTRHQKAREKIAIWFEGGQNRVIKKFPLLRGKEKNKSKRLKPYLINFQHLRSFPENAEVTIETLIEKEIVPSDAKRTGIKLVNVGHVEKKFLVKIAASRQAKLNIIKAGGKII